VLSLAQLSVVNMAEACLKINLFQHTLRRRFTDTYTRQFKTAYLRAAK